MTGSLLTTIFLCYVINHVTARCSSNYVPMFTYHPREPSGNHVFTINTCHSCRDYPELESSLLTVCEWRRLLQRIGDTENGIDSISRRLATEAPTVFGPLCGPVQNDMADINNITELLTTSYRMLSSVSLRLAVIDYENGNMECQNLINPLLCKIKLLLHGVTLNEDIHQHRLELSEINTNSMLYFKCENLKRASAILHFVKRNLRRVMRNELQQSTSGV